MRDTVGLARAVPGKVHVKSTLRANQVKPLVFDSVPVILQPELTDNGLREVNLYAHVSKPPPLQLEGVVVHLNWAANN